MSNISRKQPLDMNDLYFGLPEPKTKELEVSNLTTMYKELSLVLTFCTPNNPTMYVHVTCIFKTRVKPTRTNVPWTMDGMCVKETLFLLCSCPSANHGG